MLTPGLNRWGQILLHFGTMRLLEAVAEQEAKIFARAEQDKLDKTFDK